MACMQRLNKSHGSLLAIFQQAEATHGAFAFGPLRLNSTTSYRLLYGIWFASSMAGFCNSLQPILHQQPWQSWLVLLQRVS